MVDANRQQQVISKELQRRPEVNFAIGRENGVMKVIWKGGQVYSPSVPLDSLWYQETSRKAVSMLYAQLMANLLEDMDKGYIGRAGMDVYDLHCQSKRPN